MLNELISSRKYHFYNQSNVTESTFLDDDSISDAERNSIVPYNQVSDDASYGITQIYTYSNAQIDKMSDNADDSVVIHSINHN